MSTMNISILNIIDNIYRVGDEFIWEGVKCKITVVHRNCFDYIFLEEPPYKYKRVNGRNTITFDFAYKTNKIRFITKNL